MTEQHHAPCFYPTGREEFRQYIIGTQSVRFVDLTGSTVLTGFHRGNINVYGLSANATLTLPSATEHYNYFIANNDPTYSVIIQRSGADTIDNGLTSYTLTNQHDRIKLEPFGGTIWRTS